MKITFILLAFPMLLFSQVGIGTTTPTTQLDVNGDARVRNLSNSLGQTAPVSALPDGTLVTAFTNTSATGIKFVGNLSSDIALTNTTTFYEIILGSELIDVLNEYDNTTGRYQPKKTGYYKISMDFDIGDYTSTSSDLDILIGLWDFTTGAWVVRRTFKHTSNNNSPTYIGRSESYGISNYLQLDATHNYGFRIHPTYTSSATKDAKLKALNSGSTGSSNSTSFSIELVL